MVERPLLKLSVTHFDFCIFHEGLHKHCFEKWNSERKLCWWLTGKLFCGRKYYQDVISQRNLGDKGREVLQLCKWCRNHLGFCLWGCSCFWCWRPVCLLQLQLSVGVTLFHHHQTHARKTCIKHKEINIKLMATNHRLSWFKAFCSFGGVSLSIGFYCFKIYKCEIS